MLRINKSPVGTLGNNIQYTLKCYDWPWAADLFSEEVNEDDHRIWWDGSAWWEFMAVALINPTSFAGGGVGIYPSSGYYHGLAKLCLSTTPWVSYQLGSRFPWSSSAINSGVGNLTVGTLTRTTGEATFVNDHPSTPTYPLSQSSTNGGSLSVGLAGVRYEYSNYKVFPLTQMGSVVTANSATTFKMDLTALVKRYREVWNQYEAFHEIMLPNALDVEASAPNDPISALQILYAACVSNGIVYTEGDPDVWTGNGTLRAWTMDWDQGELSDIMVGLDPSALTHGATWRLPAGLAPRMD